MMPHSRFNRTVTIPTHDLNDGQAMGVETLAAIIIALTALMVVYGNRSHGFSGTGPILIGFSMAACHFAFVRGHHTVFYDMKVGETLIVFFTGIIFRSRSEPCKKLWPCSFDRGVESSLGNCLMSDYTWLFFVNLNLI